MGLLQRFSPFFLAVSATKDMTCVFPVPRRPNMIRLSWFNSVRSIPPSETKVSALSLDLRTIGSNSYIYTDESLEFRERATRLLRDFLAALHDALLDEITAPRSGHDLNRLSPLIDQLGTAVKEVVVRESLPIPMKAHQSQK
jgi:hypothetical protein